MKRKKTGYFLVTYETQRGKTMIMLKNRSGSINASFLPDNPVVILNMQELNPVQYRELRDKLLLVK
jgi:hypothetical protein